MRSVLNPVNFFYSRLVDGLIHSIGTILAPHRCLWCQQQSSHPQHTLSRAICADCWQQLPWLGSACIACAEPLMEPGYCGRCIVLPPAFDQASIPLRYETPANDWIQAFKYRARFSHGALLSDILLKTIQHSEEELPQCIVAVPIHRQKLKQRGFNQAAIIANDLGKWLGIKVIHNALVRKRNTPSQSGLNEKQRRQNQAGAFAATCQLPERVALVDDVVTTGSTVNACAQTLKQAGAKHVSIWALARTP